MGVDLVIIGNHSIPFKNGEIEDKAKLIELLDSLDLDLFTKYAKGGALIFILGNFLTAMIDTLSKINILKPNSTTLKAFWLVVIHQQVLF